MERCPPGVCLLAVGWMVGCATAAPESSSRSSGADEDHPVCTAPVLGVPEGAFPGLSGVRILSTLEERRLLPASGITSVVRFPGEIVNGINAISFTFSPLGLATSGASQIGSTRGPMVRDYESWRAAIRSAAVTRSDGENGVTGTVYVEAFINAHGAALATRVGPGSARFNTSSRERAASVAVQLVRRHPFMPALYRGCRISSWTVIPVYFDQTSEVEEE